MDFKDVTKEEFLQAISNGVSEAIWRMINNATSAPCHDFYDAIKQGVENAHEKIGGGL